MHDTAILLRWRQWLFCLVLCFISFFFGDAKTIPGIKLRLGLVSDATAITSFYSINLGLPIPFTTDYVALAITAFPSLVIIAENDDIMVGCVMGRFDLLHCLSACGDDIPCKSGDEQYSGHVSAIAVSDPYLRQGIGTNLLSALHSQLKDEHAISLVTLHVLTKNLAAISFYSGSFNYCCEERLSSFYGVGEDAWLMKMDREFFAAEILALP